MPSKFGSVVVLFNKAADSAGQDDVHRVLHDPPVVRFLHNLKQAMLFHTTTTICNMKILKTQIQGICQKNGGTRDEPSRHLANT